MKNTLLFVLFLITTAMTAFAEERYDVVGTHILTEYKLGGKTYTDIAPATDAKREVENLVGSPLSIEAEYTSVTPSDKGGREYLLEYNVSSSFLTADGEVGMILQGVDQGSASLQLKPGVSGHRLRKSRPTVVRGAEVSVPDLGEYFTIFVFKAKIGESDLEIWHHVMVKVDHHYGQPVTGEPESRMLYNPVVSGYFNGDNYVPEGAEVGFAWTREYLGLKPNLGDEATLSRLTEWTPAVFRNGQYLGWPTNVGRHGYFNYTFAVRHNGRIVKFGDLVMWTAQSIERSPATPEIGGFHVEAYDFWGWDRPEYYAYADIDTNGNEAQWLVTSCRYEWVWIWDTEDTGHYEWEQMCYSRGWEKLELGHAGKARVKVDIDPCVDNEISVIVVWKTGGHNFDAKWSGSKTYRDQQHCWWAMKKRGEK